MKAASLQWRNLCFTLAVLATVVLLGACARGSVTDGLPGGTFLSPDDERALGAKSHPKILNKYGGIYRDPALTRKVATIMGRLVKSSRQPKATYRLSILNTPLVNAFALPGGYVYVTRGLLALANNEAELANVLAHELSHITSRHAAKRHTEIVKAKIISNLIKGVTGAPALASAFQVNAVGHIAQYSRDQELEADRLGIETANKAGFDPAGSASFLVSLSRRNRLLLRKARQGVSASRTRSRASHPGLVERIGYARARAKGLGARRSLNNTGSAYLDALDGMLFGNPPEFGVVRKTRFIHPKLRFTFQVPKGFRLYNTRRAVIATNANNSLIFFDGLVLRPGVSLEQYVRTQFVRGVRFDRLTRRTVNGMAVVSGRTSRGGNDITLVAIQYSGRRIYRFLFASRPGETARLRQEQIKTIQSFRKLGDLEAGRIRSRRMRIVTVKRGDNIDRFARAMSVDYRRRNWFLVLNGFDKNTRLRPGQRVKTIVN